MFDYYDKSKKWVYYLTRPFTLFETSLWQAWYESEQIEQFLGEKLFDVLCVEEAHQQVRQYRIRRQLLRLGPRLFKLLAFKRKWIRELLEQAAAVNQQAAEILQRGPSYFATLEESVAFLVKLAFYGTLLPNLPVFPSFFLSFSTKLPGGRLGKKIVELRNFSFYPRFTKEIVTPLAAKRLKDAGIADAEKLVDFVTLKELARGCLVEVLKSREQCFKEGKYFIYQQIGNEESVRWIQNPEDIIRELEPRRFSKNISLIKGQVAFPGLIQGTVAIARDYDSVKDTFKEGQILVAPSTNPAMLPLMKKAAAIVTDEGGITCHAAIIARELRIPCIIGTKIATQVLKDGDRVEVDAVKGIVRKI